MRVLVTGGNGFVGRSVVQRLTKEDVEIIKLTRQRIDVDSRSDVSSGELPSKLIATLGEANDWQDRVSGIDTIVHLADGLKKLEHAQLSKAKVDKLLQSSTEFAQGALDAGIKRFIYVSSIKAIIGESASSPLNEASPPRPTTLYGRTKLALEGQLQDRFRGSKSELVILRPTIVFGHGAQGNIGRFIEIANANGPVPRLPESAKRSFTSVENFADAIAKVCTANNAEGTFIVCDNEALSTNEILSLLRFEKGKSPKLTPVPKFVWKLLNMLPGIGPKTRRLTLPLEADNTHFRHTFDWEPVTSTHDALRDMARNYQG